MHGNIDYSRDVSSFDAADFEGFFDGWPDSPDPETHLAVLRKSDAIVLAIDRANERPVGFVTAITDGILAAYISLLEVRPEWRGEGIGTRLVREVCADLEDLYMVDAVCDDDVVPFYEQLGFSRLNGMARRHYENRTGPSDDESS
jgi:ribosomal protein S18 acetylase RimI-like enzyme